MNSNVLKVFVTAFFVLKCSPCTSQDTLRVMTYNVLHYGDGCQGTNSFLHSNLKTIVQYKSPDVLGMVKVQTIKLSSTDFAGVSPVGFADSILVNGFNTAYPNRYDHCPVVNISNDADGDMDLLFFDKKKLGFVSVTSLCGLEEDFNLYKLYYKDPDLATTKDSTFLYFILNHTVSGSSSNERDTQDTLVIKSLKKRFSHLPNVISMGDFNTHSSYEPGYQLLTASADTSFVFSDPPYFPDKKLSYPSDWQTDAGTYSSYLNTSTRETTLPNACGTTDGAKGWYLHILISSWLTKNKDYIKYVPNSYTTIGNDGRREGISINDSINAIKNTSVPAAVLNALFQLSDKYPVMVKLAVTHNTSGISPPDPVLNTVTEVHSTDVTISINNPVDTNAVLHFPPALLGDQAFVEWRDLTGRLLKKDDFTVNQSQMTTSADLMPGVYILMLQINGAQYNYRLVKY